MSISSFSMIVAEVSEALRTCDRAYRIMRRQKCHCTSHGGSDVRKLCRITREVDAEKQRLRRLYKKLCKVYTQIIECEHAVKFERWYSRQSVTAQCGCAYPVGSGLEYSGLVMGADGEPTPPVRQEQTVTEPLLPANLYSYEGQHDLPQWLYDSQTVDEEDTDGGVHLLPSFLRPTEGEPIRECPVEIALAFDRAREEEELINQYGDQAYYSWSDAGDEIGVAADVIGASDDEPVPEDDDPVPELEATTADVEEEGGPR